MTTLINRVVGGSGMRTHTSKLGKFFVVSLALSTPIFKYDRLWTVELPKLPIVVTLQQWNIWDIPQLVSDDIFCWKLVNLEPRAVQKNSELKSMWPQSRPSHNSVYQHSHCSTLLIGCLNLSASLWFGIKVKIICYPSPLGNVWDSMGDETLVKISNDLLHNMDEPGWDFRLRSCVKFHLS